MTRSARPKAPSNNRKRSVLFLKTEELNLRMRSSSERARPPSSWISSSSSPRARHRRLTTIAIVTMTTLISLPAIFNSFPRCVRFLFRNTISRSQVQCTEVQENRWARLRESHVRQGTSHATSEREIMYCLVNNYCSAVQPLMT